MSFTEALLTNTETKVNRTGDYKSKLFFIEVNDSIRTGIQTTWIDESFENGTIKNGRIFFNDFEGNFLDAYRITEGKLSHRFVPKQENKQQANVFSVIFFLFQSDDDVSDCWNTDNLPFDGNFDEIEMTFATDNEAGGDDEQTYAPGTGPEDGYSPDNSAYWAYLNNANYGSGSTNNGDSNNNNCPSDREFNSATQTCDCKDGKVEDSNGNCIDACTGGKILNANDVCVCPEGTKENSEQSCTTPCENIKKVLVNNVYKTKIEDLKSSLDFEGEKGFAFLKNGATYSYEEVPETNLNEIYFTNYTTNYFGAIHTHPVEETYPIFSWGDVFALFIMYRKSSQELKSEVTYMLATSESSVAEPKLYALTINDFDAFQRKILADINSVKSPFNNSSLSIENRVKILDKRFGEILGKSDNLENTFLNHFKDFNISLYKADGALLNWTKLTPSSAGGLVITPNETPC